MEAQGERKMTPSISELHKAMNTREIRQIRIKLREEARNLKKSMAEGLSEEELVEDDDEDDLIDLEDII